ncbi:MAG: hypothetical protein KC479_06845 [Dehalococcoidia bacterium]|nr:hypothetical protein [Dehalococcoidia bacterium]
MRGDVYRLWPWLALPAATGFAIEASLQVLLGRPAPAITAAAFCAFALGSTIVARTRSIQLTGIS